jgi:transcriptional regulator with XRE-family HTH domain
MKIAQKNLISEIVGLQLSGFGASLRNSRLARRLTHQEAATACSFSRQTLSRIEQGDPSVAIGQIARYANYLGTDTALSVITPAVDSVKRRVRKSAAEKFGFGASSPLALALA